MNDDRSHSAWTAHQWRFFRVLLGAYITIHFTHLLPWSAELFSSAGMLPAASASPLTKVFPNLLLLHDSATAVRMLCLSGATAGAALMLGFHARLAALWAWFVLATFFTRNPLIANPAMPYVGWMLLAFACVPSLPGLRDAAGNSAWRLPSTVYVAAWVVLALSYSYSGYTKLLSPHWMSGDNVALVLENPLARTGWLREAFLSLPEPLLAGLTWFILAIELSFAPLALVPRLRPWLWGGMLFVQFGFLFLLNFADLTMGMLLFHLLTFDPDWVPADSRRRVARLYYDGDCGFCHATVRFALTEDRAGALRFSPLQGSRYADRLTGEGQTIVVETDDGIRYEKGSAVLAVGRSLGGLWRLLAALLGVLPRRILDLGYDAVGRVRNRLSAKPCGLCPMLPAHLAARVTRAPL